MSKQEFLDALMLRLSGLKKQEVEERLNFYSEMIDDMIEEGRTEEEALSEIGTVDDISAQIIADISRIKISKEKEKPQRRLKAWEIVLLVLGSPIWISLAAAAIAVILSLYVSLWAAIVSLWAVLASLIACAVGGVLSGIGLILAGNGISGTALIGASLVCTGLSIFLFIGCGAATKWTALLAKKIVLGIKNCFAKKEAA